MSVTINGSGQLPVQVTSATAQTAVSTTSTSFVTTNLTATITPTSSSNKVLVLLSMPAYNSTNYGKAIITVFRGTVAGTDLGSSVGVGFGAVFDASAEHMSVVSAMYLDSPSTTLATTYTVGLKMNGGGTSIAMIDSQKATLTLMEISQ